MFLNKCLCKVGHAKDTKIPYYAVSGNSNSVQLIWLLEGTHLIDGDL
jgi:hypothetical protein